uniref:class II glutamine amidotransferase n=1 Tax=Marinimicrobium alkaliphilum TaxID=2202654 RepID=UPI002FCD019E
MGEFDILELLRQTNVGSACLANTHPFTRELWGRYWLCAHNGHWPVFSPAPSFYEPAGKTDSYCSTKKASITRRAPAQRQRCGGLRIRSRTQRYCQRNSHRATHQR